MNSLPLLAAAYIHNGNGFTRFQPCGELRRAYLHRLLRPVALQDRVNHLTDRQPAVAAANFFQRLTGLKTAMGTTANVVSPKKGALRTRVFLQELCHGDRGIDL